MFHRLSSLGVSGLNAFIVDVEVDVSKGMPSFDIVGLPDNAIRESRDRVRSSVKNCGYEFPISKITVNLAPADIRKSGPIYDLPIFIALLSATKQLNADMDKCAFIGELSLKGDIRPVTGVLPMVIHAKSEGYKNIFVPVENAAEGSVVEGINVYGISHVNELILNLTGEKEILPVKSKFSLSPDISNMLDFADVKGQKTARRALEITAAGGHNALMIGPPGAGKSMLAKRLPSILPDMTFDEMIEATKIHSIAGILNPKNPIVTMRPFRSPHHTVSPAGLSGGGSVPRPGEISLAHNGVLFLDELPEFPRVTMEVLRQPIEDGRVYISRVNGTLSYPCSVMLVAAMNPCPCGYFGHATRPCTCSPVQVNKYLSKVSGPLLDRLDLHIEVMPVEYDNLSSKNKEESSAEVKKRVNAARNVQTQRYKGTNINCNAKITADFLREACPVTDEANSLLKNSFERLGLSARAYDRILKVARTIADLENEEKIASVHIAEAVRYRSLDRKYWLSGGK